MEKVVIGFSLVFLNFAIHNFLDKIFNKYKLLDKINFNKIPNWLGGAIYMVLMLLTCPAFCIILTSGFVIYDLIIAKDLLNLLFVLILTLLSHIYTIVIIK